MNIIDFHCDTVQKIFHIGNENLYENSYSVDIKKMINSRVTAQFFALFLDRELIKDKKYNIYDYTKEFYKVYSSQIKANEEYISLANNYRDYEENMKEGKMSAFLTIEEGDFLENRIERLDEFYKLGLRLITLTWNYENCIGYPNSMNTNLMSKGLKPFGFEVIEKMNELGIIIDVSHLSDGGFYDCINHSKTPVIASHSNAREITCVPRNITDDMMKELADKGGIMGINFHPHFLGNDNVSKIDHMIKHIKHIRNKAGIDALALGSDFDGIEGELEIANIGELGKLMIELEKSGFSPVEIEKICSLNAERIIIECLK
ncbi:membrane dipeptidase [Alkalibaculum sp. M08DMB]|uniref:Membrane dipeptidase n=1 Tax=Alkalibaculum sporogenes TaxID=2655001 RepID=A0A6A7K5K7_9FIRM|nr:dipeptidase [Alkalibaculum sporogenes]MPW24680.1 membrane dipeptidase [Alkalibaculum sporogenes]